SRACAGANGWRGEDPGPGLPYSSNRTRDRAAWQLLRAATSAPQVMLNAKSLFFSLKRRTSSLGRIMKVHADRMVVNADRSCPFRPVRRRLSRPWDVLARGDAPVKAQRTRGRAGRK